MNKYLASAKDARIKFDEINNPEAIKARNEMVIAHELIEINNKIKIAIEAGRNSIDYCYNASVRTEVVAILEEEGYKIGNKLLSSVKISW